MGTAAVEGASCFGRLCCYDAPMDIPEKQRPTFREAVASAGAVLARATARLNSMTPREIAEAAWHPGGLSKEELEALATERFEKARRQ